MEHPDLLDRAIEEFLRCFAPSQALARTVIQDVEFFGCSLKKGDRALLVWASANRDEAGGFEHPDELDIERWPNRHTSFGIGVHRCAELHLGLLMGKQLLIEVLTRMPDYEIDLDGLVPYAFAGRQLRVRPGAGEVRAGPAGAPAGCHVTFGRPGDGRLRCSASRPWRPSPWNGTAWPPCSTRWSGCSPQRPTPVSAASPWTGSRCGRPSAPAPTRPRSRSGCGTSASSSPICPRSGWAPTRARTNGCRRRWRGAVLRSASRCARWCSRCRPHPRWMTGFRTSQTSSQRTGCGWRWSSCRTPRSGLSRRRAGGVRAGGPRPHRRAGRHLAPRAQRRCAVRRRGPRAARDRLRAAGRRGARGRRRPPGREPPVAAAAGGRGRRLRGDRRRAGDSRLRRSARHGGARQSPRSPAAGSGRRGRASAPRAGSSPP